MSTTTHTVQPGSRQGDRVRVEHEDYAGIQYEFYIPEAIWDHPSVQAFIERLGSIGPGATVFAPLTGVWQGEPEHTRIYRMILQAEEVDLSETRSALHAEVGRLMADLSASDEFAQEVFLFTETDIRATRSIGPSRV